MKTTRDEEEKEVWVAWVFDGTLTAGLGKIIKRR